MKQHEMRLHAESFEKIKNGSKSIELRLYDEKRRQIKVGDAILFANRLNGDTVACRVVGLCVFENFAALVKALGAEPCGWTTGNPENPDAGMERYYPKEEIEKHGALGIVLEIIKQGVHAA